MLLPDHLVTACGLREQRYHYLRLSVHEVNLGEAGQGEAVFKGLLSCLVLSSSPSMVLRHVGAGKYAEMPGVL